MSSFFLAEEEGRSFEDIEQNQTIMTLGLVGEKCLTVESSLNYFSPNVGSKRCEDLFSGCAKNGAREVGVLAPPFARPKHARRARNREDKGERDLPVEIAPLLQIAKLRYERNG